MNNETKQTPVEKLFHKLWDTPKDKLNWYALLKEAKEMEKERMIQLVQSLKDYTHESHNILGHDEREASEFVDTFYEQTYGGNK